MVVPDERHERKRLHGRQRPGRDLGDVSIDIEVLAQDRTGTSQRVELFLGAGEPRDLQEIEAVFLSELRARGKLQVFRNELQRCIRVLNINKSDAVDLDFVRAHPFRTLVHG